MNIWKISGWELFRRFGQKSKLSDFLGAGERATYLPAFLLLVVQQILGNYGRYLQDNHVLRYGDFVVVVTHSGQITAAKEDRPVTDRRDP